jgi:DNA-directed RNA polymerase specialized sigma subunit
MYNSELATDMRNHCEHTNSKKNLAIYERLRAGDADARKRLICDNMPLVATVVNEYLAMRPCRAYLLDDLMGDGFLALTKAVNGLEHYHTPVIHMTSYLACAVRHALYKANDSYNEPLTGQLEGDGGFDTVDTLDTIDLLDAACLTNVDQTLLRLRREGYTNREIAAKTGLSRATAQRLIRGIYERYHQRKKNLQ